MKKPPLLIETVSGEILVDLDEIIAYDITHLLIFNNGKFSEYILTYTDSYDALVACNTEKMTRKYLSPFGRSSYDITINIVNLIKSDILTFSEKYMSLFNICKTDIKELIDAVENISDSDRLFLEL